MTAPNCSAKTLWRYRELLDEGLSRRRIHHLVVSGELRRLRKNCYVPEAHWSGLSNVERLVLQAQAHHHSLIGRDTVGHVYCHETAAVLHGLDLWQPGNDVHVTQPTRTSNASHGADVRNHSAQLTEDDVVLLHGLPVTSLLRTAIDCARSLPFDRALIVADQAMARGVTRRAALTAVDLLGPAAGVGRASAVLAAADPRSESPGETLTRSRLLRFGLPQALSQVEVATRHGRYRLDFAWLELLVGLEFDGRVKYFGAAATDEVLYEERRREKALVEEGWTILRIEWGDLFREAELEARLRGALRRAASRIAA
ncbi:type IV toxin-antitoxin system AbiEi family antitoxin domain-containing protein [Arthrobacter sp. Ld5]|uniref:type IV toxin-antitoxin system AbiEi family antitoxin domain-containing protein n=1 Tax=Arthrobacter sp. Ld5 TaxID=649152 RepID=UPI003EB844A4